MLTLMRKIAKAKFCVIALLFDSITEEGKVSKFQNVNYSEATEEKSHNNSTWLYSNTKWSPQTFNKQNNFLWEFGQNYFTVIGSAFLKVNSLIQSNFKLKSRSDQANNSCYVIEPRWYDSFRLTIFQGQCSPAAFVTWKCFRCFFTDPASFSFQSTILC